MADNLETFQKFSDLGLAATIAEKLNDLHIRSELTNEQPIIDRNIVGANPVEPTIHLKIDPADFDRAHQALEAYYETQLSNVDPDYYLLSFTNQELMDIVTKPDEWGHFDYALAKKLLADQGITISPVAAGELKQKRLAELARPSNVHLGWIIAGYISAILCGWAGGFIVGGFSMLIGAIFAFTKKTLPNGENVYTYPAGARSHGKWIFFIAIIGCIIWFFRLTGIFFNFTP